MIDEAEARSGRLRGRAVLRSIANVEDLRRAQTPITDDGAQRVRLAGWVAVEPIEILGHPQLLTQLHHLFLGGIRHDGEPQGVSFPTELLESIDDADSAEVLPIEGGVRRRHCR